MADDDAMDVTGVRDLLARALADQVGSLVTLTLLAGGLRGPSAVALKDTLQSFAVAEVADTQRLAEKLAALGGRLQPYEVPPPPPGELEPALRAFLAREERVVRTLHAVIGPSGQEPQSEALEHPIEHVLLRKQHQLDVLRLALEE